MPDATIPAPARDDVAGHDQVESFREDIAFPEHVQRSASPEFVRNRKQLIGKLGVGCFVCGSRDALEAHHFICEWALWPDVDPAKVLAVMQHFDIYGFAEKMGDQPVQSPDDIRNLMILCGSHPLGAVTVEGGHHRGVDLGIHRMTFPSWIGQKIAKDGVVITKALSGQTPAPATT